MSSGEPKALCKDFDSDALTGQADNSKSKHLRSVLGYMSQPIVSRASTSEVGVQTLPMLGGDVQDIPCSGIEKSSSFGTLDHDDFQLSAADLTAILRWSKDISSDINLSSGEYYHAYGFYTIYFCYSYFLQLCNV